MRSKTIKNLMIGMTSAVLLGSAMTASALSVDPNASLPGIAPAGQPAFTFNDNPGDYSEQIKSWYSNILYVQYQGVGSGYTFYGFNSGNFTFFDAVNSSFGGTNGEFYLEANFDDTGNFVDGFVTVQGAISGLGINSVTSLMTADLIAYAFDGDLVGFGIDITSCAVQIDCNTVPESIYFFTLGNMVDIGALDGQNYRGTMANKTTVPLPAAVWLMLSALGLVGAVSRRKQTGA